MPSAAPFWLDRAPLLLASRSAARQALLRAAGIAFEAWPADIDEPRIQARMTAAGALPSAVASRLARDKAQAASRANPGRLVLGADQALALGTELFVKPADRQAAAHQLTALSGRTHVLHSALALVRDGIGLFETTADARLTMRDLSPGFIEGYLDAVGEAALHSVGAYQYEGLGIHLFAAATGDQSTIMGLPLLPLLAFLRARGYLAA